jgi:hypothetical protein
MSIATDYKRLRQEFVTGEMSITTLAETEGLAKSTLARQARKEDPMTHLNWYREREAYRSRVVDQTYDLLAEGDAGLATQRMMKILSISDEVLDYFRDEVKAGRAKISAKDAAVWAQIAQVASGKPSKVTQEQHLGLGLLAATPDLARLLEDASRQQIADNGTVAGTPVVVVEGPSPD